MITLIILAMLSAYEETQQLIQRGSWKKEDYWIPIWETKWDGFWKLFDSHHLAFGAFVLVMSHLLITGLNWAIAESIYSFIGLEASAFLVEVTNVIILWVFFFYIRNIFMHIVFPKKDRKWIYLIPMR